MNNNILAAAFPFLLLFISFVLRFVALMQLESWKQALLTSAARWLMGISLVVMMLTAIVMLVYGNDPTGIFGLLIMSCFVSIFVGVEIRSASMRNRARQVETLWVMALAVRSGRPLADEIEAYAQAEHGPRHRLLMEMAERLREGASLSELAVPQGLLPRSTEMQIHSGIASNSLADSLTKTAIKASVDFGDQEESELPTGIVYPPTIMVVASIVMAFIMFSIVPKFKKIFEDFNTELPDSTRFLIATWDAMWVHWFALGLPIVVYFPLGILCISAIAEYYGWQAVLYWIVGRWYVRWHTPDVLRALSQSLSQKMPILGALEPIAQYSRSSLLRGRLAKATDAIEEGENCWQTLESVGLLRASETVLLEIAQDTGNVPWIMNSLAMTIERRRMYRLRSILTIVQPIALIPVAVIVGAIIFSLFMPLVKMLNDLS